MIQLTLFPHWFRQCLGLNQATSYYLAHWWLDYRRIYASLGLNGLNGMIYHHMWSYAVQILCEGFMRCSPHRSTISSNKLQLVLTNNRSVIRMKLSVSICSENNLEMNYFYHGLWVENLLTHALGSRSSANDLSKKSIPRWAQQHHDDVIQWKPFPRHWPFVRGIHRSPVNSPHKVQWRGAWMFSLICA